MSRLTAFLLLLLLCCPVQADTTRFDSLIRKHSQTYSVDFNLIKAMIRQESNFKIRAVSSANAQGLMQMIPATAKRFGVTDVYSPDQNIRGGTRYIKWLLDRYAGNLDFALAGYNAGEGKVDRYNGIPPYRETRNYVKHVKRFYRDYQNKAGGYRPSHSIKAITKQIVTAIAHSLQSFFKDSKLFPEKAIKRAASSSTAIQEKDAYSEQQATTEVGSVTRVYATNRHRAALGHTRIRAADNE